jgi:glutathione S-transferase
MKLYYHPASTTCRPIMLLAAAEKLDIDYHVIDLFAGENYQPAFTAINPNQAVPFLEDGDFHLAESSTILKYLADRQRSPAYPSDLRERARVNERMDWFNTGLYRDLGYGFVYPQVIESYRYLNDEVQSATLANARENVKKWLMILDEHLIGPKNAYVCGARLTIADFLGACMITLGEVIRLDDSAYPNTMRWLANMKAIPYWDDINDAFYTYFVAPYDAAPFERL